jgi:hypothetical protein
MNRRLAMNLCPECGPGPQHNEKACDACLENLKNVLVPFIRRPPPEAKDDEKEIYILNRVVADLVFEAIVREDISPSSTALLSMKEAYVSALTEQREYGQQLANEAAAKLERLGVK